MAKYSNVNTRVFIDQYALSGFLNAVEMSVKQELVMSTGFVPDISDATQFGPRRLPGNYDHSHNLTGFFDGDSASVDEIVDSLIDEDDHYLLELWGTYAEASVAYEAVVRLANKPITGALGGAVLLNISTEGSNGMSRGMVIRNTTISGNGNGTGREVGASTSGQTYQSVIRVISGTFTSFDVNIDQSQNDGGGDPYANVAALSQTGIEAAGVWRKTTTSATEAWKRVSIANWNGTSALVLVTTGLVAGT